MPLNPEALAYWAKHVSQHSEALLPPYAGAIMTAKVAPFMSPSRSVHCGPPALLVELLAEIVPSSSAEAAPASVPRSKPQTRRSINRDIATAVRQLDNERRSDATLRCQADRGK